MMIFKSVREESIIFFKLRLASKKNALIIRSPEQRKMFSKATLAQLVERNLAKVEVTSSNLVCRSKLKSSHCT